MLGLSGQVNVPVAAKLPTKHISLGCGAGCCSDTPPSTWANPVKACASIISASPQCSACSGLDSFLTFSSPATVVSWPAAVMWDPHSALTVYVTT